jgi:hypothetical protein
VPKLFESRVLAVAVGAAVVVGLGSTGAWAAAKIGSDDIRDGGVRTMDIRNGGVQKNDVHGGAVGSHEVVDESLGLVDMRPSAVNSLRGAQGPRGPRGSQGPRGPAGPRGAGGEDASTCTIPGVQFAINDLGRWTVLARPFSTPNVRIKLEEDGVRLRTDNDDGYTDAGVIVPIGTVGDLFDAEGMYVGPPLAGGDGGGPLATNLYVDTTGDQAYLSFGVGGSYIGDGGDTIWFSYQGDPQRSDFTAGDDALAWAWTGVAGDEGHDVELSSAAGLSLGGCGDED